MRLLRGLPGAVLWILAAVLGLVGVLLCATIILLPVGIPLVKLAVRLFSHSIQLILPRAVAHPVDQFTKSARRATKKSRKAARKRVKNLT